MPPGTEARLASFTELVGTAIANAESSAELAASRRRIVAAADEARRRFERDLHDGAQQRLVSLGLELQGAEALTPDNLEDLRAQLSHVGEGLTGLLDDLRELSRGIHPAILSEGGLQPALGSLARRSAVPVKLKVSIEGGLEEGIEVAAYYVVSEALTNVVKHADAGRAEVTASVQDGMLRVQIRDDGTGGADPDGHGLVGIRDRVTTLGGRLEIDSPAGKGTLVAASLPLGAGQRCQAPAS
jgi:signal transduction histidine kinase